MAKVAVILSGSGRMDGSEVHESTLSLLYLAQGGASYQCFAPEDPQLAVKNHLTGETMQESRSQIVEAARIARGDIAPLQEAKAEDFDALLIPGGAGTLKNLGDGPGGLRGDFRSLVEAFADAQKPVAAICIAPVLVARALGSRGVVLTIGNDAETVQMLQQSGASHIDCSVGDCVADEKNRVVSTPAYMLGPGIADVAGGIEATVQKLLSWCHHE